MAWWITIYCKRECEDLTPVTLLHALRGGHYEALADEYGVPEGDVAPALRDLAVSPDLEVHFGWARPLLVHVWDEPDRVREELDEAREVRDVPASVDAFVSACCSVVAIELGFSMLENMGVVIAYEVARYVAQKYDGVIVDDDDRWQRVVDGELVPIAE